MKSKMESFTNNPPFGALQYNQNEKEEEKAPIKFCLYARKSSESDERQAMSIDSQIKEMLEYSKRENIAVKEIRQESHSAKESMQRPIFNQLIKDIRERKFNGILTWATDRLSRNAGDLGSLVDLMDDGFLLEIQTYNQKFSNSPNEKFLLMILGSQAKLENDNRGINAKRGMKAKCEMGYRPNLAPLGFINIKANHTIRIDSKRAPIIREVFEKVAYLGYRGRDIVRWLDEVGFRTRNGKKVPYSVVYAMLSNPYYAGLFEAPKGSGKWYKTKHKAIVDRDLFNLVQQKLVVHPKTWPGTKKFDFTKTLKCGACGSGITASEKIKKSKKSQRRYVYYHCTKFRDLDCHESYIREEVLVERLLGLFDKIPAEKIEADEEIKLKVAEFVDLGESVKRYNKEAHLKISKKMEKIDAKSYAEYILKHGTKEEKQALLKGLNTNIYLKNKKIYI